MAFKRTIVRRPGGADLQYPYHHRRWYRLRAHQLKLQPLCAHCKLKGKVEPATVVDHIIAHKGDLARFWDTTNLQSLCTSCHDRKTRDEKEQAKPFIRGTRPDGMPVDKRHWAWQDRGV